MFAIKRLLIFLALLLGVTGCVNEDKDIQTGVETDLTEVVITPTPSSSPKPTPTPTPEPTPDLTGLAVNPRTGEYIDESVAARRPVAVVINNLKKALPQSGISQADMYYEVLAEGEITRIIPIFSDFDSEKIGPVRSTRHYFLDFALDNDAIFVHHGGSPNGYASIQSLGINSIDGMRDGNAFWRDEARFNTPGMYEHSSYTNAERILASAERREFRMDFKAPDEPRFGFYEEFSFPDNGELSNKVTVPFSGYQQSVFQYDYRQKCYMRYQGQDPHMDEESGTQLSVTNIIVQFADMYVIAGDEAGRREVKTVASGKGWLITGGQYTPITWAKASHKAPTRYYDEQGEPLRLNKGKTWICVFQDYGEVIFE